MFSFIVQSKKYFVKRSKRGNIGVVQIIATGNTGVQIFSYKGVSDAEGADYRCW